MTALQDYLVQWSLFFCKS